MKMLPLLTRFLGLCVLLALALFMIGPNTLPTTIALWDDQANIVGYGFAVEQNKFVTAEHIWVEHPSLFYNQVPIEVLQRDTEKDLLYFSLSTEISEPLDLATWRHFLLEIGETLYWGDSVGEVIEINATTVISNRSYSDLIVLSGTVAPGLSGSPVYDSENKVVGMIVGGGEAVVYVALLKG